MLRALACLFWFSIAMVSFGLMPIFAMVGYGQGVFGALTGGVTAFWLAASYE